MAEVEKDDLLADVRAAFDGVERETETPLSNETGGVTLEIAETEQEKADRVRDEQGRFAKADEKAKNVSRETLRLKPKETPAGPAPTDIPGSEGSTPQAAAGGPQASAAAAPTDERIAPPPEWKGAGKVDWNKLPKPIQEEIRQDYEARAREREANAPLEQAIAPFRDEWVSVAGSVASAVSQLGQFYKLYVENPVALIQHIARTRGIDLGVAQGQPQAQGGSPQAPDINSVVMQAVQQAIAPIQQRFQQTENQQIEQTLEEFRADPRHPYFEDVRVAMGKLIEAGLAKGLPDAYEQAVKLNPAIWSAIQASSTEEATKAQAAAAAKAKQAAAASLRGAPLPNGHSGGGAGQGASVLDDVRAAAEELSGP